MLSHVEMAPAAGGFKLFGKVITQCGVTETTQDKAQGFVVAREKTEPEEEEEERVPAASQRCGCNVSSGSDEVAEASCKLRGKSVRPTCVTMLLPMPPRCHTLSRLGGRRRGPMLVLIRISQVTAREFCVLVFPGNWWRASEIERSKR
uniref:Uncharacterized protein n=1 Tax=Oryza brachyantha TaxID=4533 RepID=J3L488_ORYBR